MVVPGLCRQQYSSLDNTFIVVVVGTKVLVAEHLCLSLPKDCRSSVSLGFRIPWIGCMATGVGVIRKLGTNRTSR